MRQKTRTQFQAQDKQVQYETVSAQLASAKAAQQSGKLALDSEIGGVNTSVAQLQAQLDNSDWELSQTAVRTPVDGYVTVVAWSVGDRALQARSATSFIMEDDIAVVGMLAQNGFQAVKQGAPVVTVFDNVPAASIMQGSRNPEGDRSRPDRRVRDAGAHGRARWGRRCTRRHLHTGRDEPGLAFLGMSGSATPLLTPA
ncbi:multidrug resistance efflux pump [Bradyrhizobium sp. GM2.4]